MKKEPIHSCPELIDYIRETGFLPLLSMGISSWSAEEVTDEECQYTQLPDGGWEWPPIHTAARWWIRVALMGMERRDHTEWWSCLRQVHQQ